MTLTRSRARGRVTPAVHHASDSEDDGRTLHRRLDLFHDRRRLPAITSLTVWRKSLLYGCSGFTVIGPEGDLVFRVDNYIGRPCEIVLMDANGKSILLIRRRKKLILRDEWRVYGGEADDRNNKRSPPMQKRPICHVKKSVDIIRPKSNILARVFQGSMDKGPAYVIEGSYLKRSCKVLDKSRKIVAEIRKKEAMNGCASFGLEVFDLIVWPRFDSGFAMAIVLLLDQMFV
ncbi:hypothetical protein Nepgr_028549 [Nepenthes gracilis]|uniref:Protein LURP-one-related 5-like n=1 Tax=Nepenthes gracilis TaxID=150966 RepID=A0AAD3TD92_NEPGR|nr:hypothetical protein Nepgr_028549 [Nepenthes gracilis]